MSAVTAGLPARRVGGLGASRWPWGTIALLVAVAVADAIVQPSLLHADELGLLLQTAMPAVLLGVAQTLAVLVRGIDLSVGSVMVVADVLTATKLGGNAGDHLALLPLVLACGAAIGLLNGALIAWGGLEPFVATLATWAIFDGVALWILPSDGGAVPQRLTDLAIGQTAGLANSIWFLALIVAGWLALRRSRLGTRMLAVGSDEDRAFLNGVSVRRTKVVVYGIAGLVASVAGVYLAATTSTGTPTAGDGYLLPSLAAVVIGGTALSGGRGGAGLSIMGVFVLTLIADLVTGLQLPSWVSVLVSAALLLIVVGLRAMTGAARERRRA